MRSDHELYVQNRFFSHKFGKWIAAVLDGPEGAWLTLYLQCPRTGVILCVSAQNPLQLEDAFDAWPSTRRRDAVGPAAKEARCALREPRQFRDGFRPRRPKGHFFDRNFLVKVQRGDDVELARLSRDHDGARELLSDAAQLAACLDLQNGLRCSSDGQPDHLPYASVLRELFVRQRLHVNDGRYITHASTLCLSACFAVRNSDGELLVKRKDITAAGVAEALAACCALVEHRPDYVATLTKAAGERDAVRVWRASRDESTPKPKLSRSGMDEYHSLLAQCRERGLKSGGTEAMLRERIGLPPSKDRAAPPRQPRPLSAAARLRASAVPPDPLPAWGAASSLFAGVVWSRVRHVWVAYYYLLDREKKRQHNVGNYATEQLAARARHDLIDHLRLQAFNTIDALDPATDLIVPRAKKRRAEPGAKPPAKKARKMTDSKARASWTAVRTTRGARRPVPAAPAPAALEAPARAAPAPTALETPARAAPAPVALETPARAAPAPVALEAPAPAAPAPAALETPAPAAPAPAAPAPAALEAPTPAEAASPLPEAMDVDDAAVPFDGGDVETDERDPSAARVAVARAAMAHFAEVLAQLSPEERELVLS